MYHVRQENLPFVGSSHEFVGAEQGNTSVSVFLFDGKPGSGPGPHRHPYDEIQFIREGRGVWTVSGKTFEGSAGDIFVIKAGEIHSFKVVGDSPLVGCGFYADDNAAVSCTGHGEDFIRLLIAKRAADFVASGATARDAAMATIAVLGSRATGNGGLIVVDRLGNVGFAWNSEHMSYAYMAEGIEEPVTGV